MKGRANSNLTTNQALFEFKLSSSQSRKLETLQMHLPIWFCSIAENLMIACQPSVDWTDTLPCVLCIVFGGEVDYLGLDIEDSREISIFLCDQYHYYMKPWLGCK